MIQTEMNQRSINMVDIVTIEVPFGNEMKRRRTGDDGSYIKIWKHQKGYKEEESEEQPEEDPDEN